jgi:predicted ArsR family transcriptional regulator
LRQEGSTCSFAATGPIGNVPQRIGASVTEPAPSPPSTKRTVLELIKRKGPQTVAQLSEALELTGPAVRRHLETLETEGLLAQTTRALGRGRPAHLYALTEAGHDLFPRNYDQLASQLLDAVACQLGEEGVERMFAHRQRILAQRYAGRTSGRELPELAGELAAIQDENGYMAEWQPDGEERFLVREHNCAIARVAGAHPSACAYELALFRQLAGPEVEVDRVAHMQAGDLECAYVLRGRAEAQAADANGNAAPDRDGEQAGGHGLGR